MYNNTMKNTNSHNQDYYDRKLARAEETTVLLAKVTSVIVLAMLLAQVAYWLWNALLQQ